MRIFYAADHEPFPGNNLWHNNLYLPLMDLGHHVIPFDYDLTPHFQNANIADPRQMVFIEKNRPHLEKALLKQIQEVHRKEPIDIFFSYFYSALCRPEVILKIRAMGICTINWYCNASYQFDLVKEIAPAYDYCLVPEKFRLGDYRCIGANPIYCQEAANPNIYKPHPLPKEFDVTFIGQMYGDRPEYIRYLLDAGINVNVWGNGWLQQRSSILKKLTCLERWKHIGSMAKKLVSGLPFKYSSPSVVIPSKICNPPLSDDELIKMYSRSKINLGFSSCGDTHHSGKRVMQIRLRDFEVPMSGGFYMVEYMKELEEFFEIGKEIICYHDKADLVEKIKYYLNHDAEREQIRQKGYKRAINEHTWQKRFEKVFNEIGLIL